MEMSQLMRFAHLFEAAMWTRNDAKWTLWPWPCWSLIISNMFQHHYLPRSSVLIKLNISSTHQWWHNTMMNDDNNIDILFSAQRRLTSSKYSNRSREFLTQIKRNSSPKFKISFASSEVRSCTSHTTFSLSFSFSATTWWCYFWVTIESMYSECSVHAVILRYGKSVW